MPWGLFQGPILAFPSSVYGLEAQREKGLDRKKQVSLDAGAKFTREKWACSPTNSSHGLSLDSLLQKIWNVCKQNNNKTLWITTRLLKATIPSWRSSCSSTLMGTPALLMPRQGRQPPPQHGPRGLPRLVSATCKHSTWSSHCLKLHHGSDSTCLDCTSPPLSRKHLQDGAPGPHTSRLRQAEGACLRTCSSWCKPPSTLPAVMLMTHSHVLLLTRLRTPWGQQLLFYSVCLGS